MDYQDIRTDFDDAPGFGVWYGQPYASMPFHWHDQIEINYAVGGDLTYLLAGSLARVPSGRLSLFWAGVPHSVVSSTGIKKFYWAYVPLVWVLRLGLPGSFMRRVMGGDMVVDTDPLEADHEILDRWSAELPHANAGRRHLIVREVETRVMRFALSQADEAEDAHVPSAEGPVQKVSEMARFVSDNHSGALQTADVARHVGLHPNYAMTLFRRYYGMTLNTYVARLRVCRAQYLLISTNKDVSRIAYDTGFGSISRFYEAFKKISGHTPAQYRKNPETVDDVSRSPYNPCSPRGNGSCP